MQSSYKTGAVTAAALTMRIRAAMNSIARSGCRQLEAPDATRRCGRARRAAAARGPQDD